LEGQQKTAFLEIYVLAMNFLTEISLINFSRALPNSILCTLVFTISDQFMAGLHLPFPHAISALWHTFQRAYLVCVNKVNSMKMQCNAENASTNGMRQPGYRIVLFTGFKGSVINYL
jgi:hypothetical protein